ncbi:MAG: DUF2333 family protein, partial [Pseudomonadota bacterium]
MSMAQSLRRIGSRTRRSLQSVGSGASSRIGQLSAQVLAALLGVFLIALFIYYFIGSKLVHRIDDNLDYKPPVAVLPNQSHAVAMAAGLMEREVDGHGWVSNDPFYYPSAVLDNMPNFQAGIKESVEIFTEKMRDNLGRKRGSSEIDESLRTARSRLGTDPSQWIWDPSESALPRQSAESLSRPGIENLQDYNSRLGQGIAFFDPRSDNLRVTLDAIA